MSGAATADLSSLDKACLRHAESYRQEAEAYKTRRAEWIVGTREERIAEKLELAAYFERLAKPPAEPALHGLRVTFR